MPEAGCRMRVDGDLGDFSRCQFIGTLNLKATAPGFEGKMAIHPSQIEIIHQVLTPAKGQIVWANEVIEAMAGEQVLANRRAPLSPPARDQKLASECHNWRISRSRISHDLKKYSATPSQTRKKHSSM
jgi:hypothetical protein